MNFDQSPLLSRANSCKSLEKNLENFQSEYDYFSGKIFLYVFVDFDSIRFPKSSVVDRLRTII